MKDLIRILSWLLFIFLAVIFQINHFLSFRGINPNLILLTILLAVSLEKEFRKVLVLILTVILLSVVFVPDWFLKILILGGLLILAAGVKKFLTGTIFFDFLILIFLGTLVFYLIVNFHYFITNPIAIIAELFYNMTLGAALVIILNLFDLRNEKKTRIKS